MIKLLLCITVAHFANAACSSGNYTIGGSSRDYATITSAVAALTSNGLWSTLQAARFTNFVLFPFYFQNFLVSYYKCKIIIIYNSTTSIFYIKQKWT